MHTMSMSGEMVGNVAFIHSKFIVVESVKKTDKLECKGKPYSTKPVLSCPLHSLAYEIELNEIASMANDLVHPVLKRGHSNWLEAALKPHIAC
jgi:hypothetical protein